MLEDHPAPPVRPARTLRWRLPLLVVVTDVVMPEINGAVLSREIGRTRPSLRTLFMSGFADDTIEHHGVLAGGTAFLQKPFTAAALTQKVREVLDGPASTTDH